MLHHRFSYSSASLLIFVLAISVSSPRRLDAQCGSCSTGPVITISPFQYDGVIDGMTCPGTTITITIQSGDIDRCGSGCNVTNKQDDTDLTITIIKPSGAEIEYFEDDDTPGEQWTSPPILIDEVGTYTVRATADDACDWANDPVKRIREETFEAGGCCQDYLGCCSVDPCSGPDCNGNGITDTCEVECDPALDCNENGVPDDCDIDITDPDGNGLVSHDCNDNGRPDECDLIDGTLDDCDGDGVADECGGACPPVHIVFVMDTSGSMNGEGSVLCLTIDQILQDLQQTQSIDVTYELLGITGTRWCLTDSVTNLLGSAVPGNPPACCTYVNQYEDWGPATAVVAGLYQWPDGIRIIIPISDEGPENGNPCCSDCDYDADICLEPQSSDRDSILHAINVALNHDVIVSPITGVAGWGCSIHCVESEADLLATGTGGVWVRAEDTATDLPAAIVNIIQTACNEFDDCNDNGEPDSCEPDCNGNGIPDDCDLEYHPEWDVDPQNDIIDVCEIPPTANLIVYDAIFGDEIAPDGDGVWRVSECRALRIDASESMAAIPGGLTFAWDLDGQSDFASPDAQTPSVLHSNVSDAQNPGISTIQVRLTDAAGSYADAEVVIEFADTEPVISLDAPDIAAPSELICLDGAAYGSCDEIVVLEWDFHYDGTFDAELQGTIPDDFSPCVSYDTPQAYTVAMRVVDSDGSEKIEQVTILIQGENPPYSSFSNDIVLDARYHVHEDQPGVVRHRSEIRGVNMGEAPADGPIFATFENLTPTGTTIVNAVPPGGVLDGLGVPYIEILPDGQTLDPSQGTEWMWAEWDIPAGAAEPFGYQTSVFVLQRPPYFVTEPPNLDDQNTDFAVEGVLYEYDAEAVDPEGLPVYYQLDVAPEGMTINSTSGLIQWLPSQTAAANGPYPVTVVALDSYAGLQDTQSYLIDVEAVNVPPVITSTPETVGVAGQRYEYVIEAEDADNDPLPFENYSLFLAPAGVELVDAPEGPTVVFDDPAASTYAINIRLTDGQVTVKQDYLLQVVSCLVDDRPVILRDADCVDPGMEDCETGIEGQPYLKQVLLSYEPPDANISYFLDVAPDGMDIDESTGLIEWLPGFNDHGQRLVRVRAVAGGQCKDTYAFSIDVEDRNAPPVINTLDLGGATEGVQFIRVIQASDPDEDFPLGYALLEKPAGMLINPESGQIFWTPTQTAAADYPQGAAVKVKVTDPSGAFAEMDYLVPITAVNVPPQFTSLPTTVMTEGEFYEYQVTAYDADNPADPDGIALTYELEIKPAGMVINDTNNGLIEWQTLLGSYENSPYFVRVSVTDGENTVYQPFEINVYQIPPIPNDGPVIHAPPYPESYAIIGDGQYIYQVDATDQDVIDGEDDFIEYRLENAPASMSIQDHNEPNPGLITMDPTVEDLGPGGEPRIYENVRIVVEDQRGAWASLTFGLAIYPEGTGNQPPQIVSDPVFVAQVNAQYEYMVEATDPDDETLYFDLMPAPANGPDGGPLVAPPAGMEINPIPGEPKKALITWTPTIDDVGTRWIKVTVRDEPDGEPSYQQYTLTASVVGNNTPPQIVSTPELSATIEVEYTYDVQISDPDPADSHTFELLQKPAGASIDEDTGLITWTPTAAQLGVRFFEVQVTDSGGAWARQTWGVGVNQPGDPCPNVPPEITSSPEQLVHAGTQWSYDVVFTDDNIADGPLCDEVLTMTLEQRPAGMIVDPADDTRIIWDTTDPGDIGTHLVRVRVTDARGAWYQQTFELYVSNVLGNHGPQITSTPPAQAQVGVEYQYAVTVFDEDTNPQDALAITLQQKPTGASLVQSDNNNALITWTPQLNQVGPNSFSVRVTDEHGAWQQQNFTLTVSLDGQNLPPQITSEPTFVVAQGGLYTYQVDATDPDPGDVLNYSLDIHPDGMSINSNTGLIQWQTAADQPLDSYEVKVRVEDQAGAWATQSYFVTVSVDGTNRAPRIITEPSHLVELGEVYTYAMEAVDEDDDPLFWSLLEEPPVGVATLIDGPDSTTKTLEWDTAGLVDTGTYYFRVRVEDDRGGWFEQYFSVTVWQGAPNNPPTIISEPPSNVTQNSVFEYIVEATDPEDDDVIFSLTDQPMVGVPAINDIGGDEERASITWDTTGVDFGDYSFTVRADDGEGGWAEQTFVVSVGPNLPPTITSAPPLIAVVQIPYTYQIEAIDPDDAELTYGFPADFTPPGDMAIADPTVGELTWTPTAEGDYDVRVFVEDGVNAPVEQAFIVRVFSQDDGDFASPIVSITLDVLNSDDDDEIDLDPPTSDDTVNITITATDDIGITNDQVTLRIEGPIDYTPQEWTLDLVNDQVTHPFTPTIVGGYRIVATATDAADQVGIAEAQITVNTDATTESTDPQVAITYPSNVADDPEIPPSTPQLDGVVSIQGWAFDNNFDRYELAYRPIGDNGPFYTFHTGYQRVGQSGFPAELGLLDTTQMVNGTYDLLLTAYDVSGNSAVAIQTFAVKGGAKVGNFTMSFEDMKVQMGGVPVSVVRTYDSRIKTKEDFGFGWDLELTRVELQESFPIEQGWEVYTGGIGFTCAVAEALSHTISIRWPDGRLEVFAVQLDYNPNQYSSGCPTVLLNSYDAIDFIRVSPGTSELRLKGNSPEWVVNFTDGGRLTTDYDPVYGSPLWVNTGYVVTSLDGTEYEFGARNPSTGVSKLTRVTNRNGQSIQFTENGIFPDNGPGVLIQRDGQGRIVKIIDPEQNDINYQYDSAGDLVAVTDRTDFTTSFEYNNDHGLLEIIDPRGITVGRNVYDDNDRLITIIDAAGNRTEYCRPSRENPPAECVSPEELAGASNPNGYALPDVPSGQCQDYEGIVDVLGNATVHCYNTDGNVTFSINTSRGAADELTIVAVKANHYDSNGRVESEIDEVGTTTSRTFQGDTELVLTEAITNSGGISRITEFSYNTFGQPGEIRDPLGRETVMSYDQYGNITNVSLPEDGSETSSTFENGRLASATNAVGITSGFSYDDYGRLIAISDYDGNTTSFEYDNNGNQISETKSRVVDGVIQYLTTTTEYDAAGRVVRITDPDGSFVEKAYNSIGKLASETNARGFEKQYEYNAVGLLKKVQFADGSLEEYWYDNAGRRIRSIDRDGRQTKVEYDDFGHPTRVYEASLAPGDWSSVPFTETKYDALGRPLLIYKTRTSTEPQVLVIENQYVGDQHIVIRHNQGEQATTVSTLDGAEQVISVLDANNNALEYEYDDNGQRVLSRYPATDDYGVTTSRVVYDDAGRKTQEIDQAGHVTRYEYDLANRVSKIIDANLGETQFIYDAVGNLTRRIDAEGRETVMQYDALGRIVRRDLPLGQVETFSYDVNGNEIRHTDFNGQTTLSAYDQDDRLSLKAGPGGVLSGDYLDPPVATGATGTASWYLNSDQTELTVHCVHQLQNPAAARIQFTNAHDGASIFELGTGASPVDVTLPLTDLDVESLLNGDLYLVILTGEPASPTIGLQLSANPSTTEFEYSPAGLRTRAGGDTYAYNDRGLLEFEFKASGDVLRYEYNSAGNRTLTELTEAGNVSPTNISTYEFDDLGRLWRVYDVTSGSSVLITEYSYDLVGNRTQLVNHANGTRTDYEYDELNRLTRVTNKGAGDAVISDYEYSLEASGNRSAVVEHHNIGPAGPRTVTYEYDDLYRLTSEIVSNDPNDDNLVVTYSLDDVGNRLTQAVMATDQIALIDYQYDENDRLTTETRATQMARANGELDGAKVAAGPTRPSSDAAYVTVVLVSASGIGALIPVFVIAGRSTMRGRRRRRQFVRRASISLSLVPLTLIGVENAYAQTREAILYQMVGAAVFGPGDPIVEVFSYTYDDNGNMLSRNDGVNQDDYTYDSDNRLSAVSRSINASVTATYQYDADGIRIAKSVGANTIDFVCDKNREFAEVIAERSGEESVQYLHGDDLIRMSRPDSGDRYYLYDGQLSVRQLTDIDAAVTDEYTFDAFGSLITESSPLGNPTANSYRYSGEQFDDATNSYYLRARYYQPDLGRFNTRDPFGGFLNDPMSLHKYIYANVNPVMNRDPSGLFSIATIAITSGIVGVLVGITTYAITGSVKKAIIFGLGAAILTALIMILLPHLPRLISWLRNGIRNLIRNEQSHQTVSGRTYARMKRMLGDDKIKDPIARANFLKTIPWWKRYTYEWVVGYATQFSKLFFKPFEFIRWFTPTKSGGIGFILVLVLLIVFWPQLKSLSARLSNWLANQLTGTGGQGGNNSAPPNRNRPTPQGP